jgi:hypothetical protein
MSGYNTVHEMLQTGTRALLVPMKKKMEDIDVRVERLVRRGRARCLSPTDSPARYEQEIDELLGSPRPAPEPCTGGGEAARAILKVSKAPRRYVFSREPLSAALATAFKSPRRLARAMMENQESNAIVRVDWDRVEPLLDQVGPSKQGLIAGLEVVIGGCEVDEAVRRMRAVHEFLEERQFGQDELLFCVDDPSGGSLLAELTEQVRDLRFKALVARFTPDTLKCDTEKVFESLELCREKKPAFKIDITLLDETFVFVDQP